MIFLTNKALPAALPKETMGKISVIPYDSIMQTTFPGGAVIDIVGRCPAIQTLVSKKNIGYFNGNIEYHTGSTIYIFMDMEKCVLKVEL